MPGRIETYFRQYRCSEEQFIVFHNEVINMPRPDFQNIGLEIIQHLAHYLLLAEDRVDNVEGNNYKQIMEFIHDELIRGHYPVLRDAILERSYFVFDNLDQHYSQTIQGRMFRHCMGLCSFWGLIKSITSHNKVINFDVCRDIISLLPEYVTDYVRNLGLSVDIQTNDFLRQLRGIAPIRPNSNYHPTLAILRYMKELNRPVTDFEISVLLGRIDELQDDALVLRRAVDIGNSFISRTREGQRQEFFRAMGWIKEDGTLFTYKSSQQPWFKFHTYLLFLEDFGFIRRNNTTQLYSITQEALTLLGDIPANVLDLNRLLAQLDLEDGSLSSRTMKDILLRANMDALRGLVSNAELLKRFNHYSLEHPIEHQGKRCRNQFIAELARIRENYMCQAGSVTFERPDGRNYVEAHHIIEFSKGGPDILENLLVLGPTPHAQIHRGSESARQDAYTHLMSRGALNFELFKIMVKEYHALTPEHLDFLQERRIISNAQKQELLTLGSNS